MDAVDEFSADDYRVAVVGAGFQRYRCGSCRGRYLDSAGHSVLWPGPSWRFARRLRRVDSENYASSAWSAVHGRVA